MTSTIINVRIDAALKAEAEEVLRQIGLTPSEAIRMFYRQVIMRQGLPFDACIVLPQGKKDK